MSVPNDRLNSSSPRPPLLPSRARRRRRRLPARQAAGERARRGAPRRLRRPPRLARGGPGRARRWCSASAHESIFMAGARLEEFPDEHFGAEAAGRRVDLAQGTFARVQRLPKPVVAAITGHALGGGCELALACDFRFMAAGERPDRPAGDQARDHPRRRRHAAAPAPRRARARAALLLLGERLGAEAAAAIGLVDEACADPDATLALRRALAARLAEMPAPGRAADQALPQRRLRPEPRAGARRSSGRPRSRRSRSPRPARACAPSSRSGEPRFHG